MQRTGPAVPYREEALCFGACNTDGMLYPRYL